MSPEPPSDDTVGDDVRVDGRDETRNERADRNWDELMQELRVMQTGTQILTGFLLAVAFQPRFTETDALQRQGYVVLVALASLATILALAPVVMHRTLFGRRRKPGLVDVAARIVKIDLVVIAALTIGVTTLIIDFTVNRTAGIITLIVSVIGVLLLWLAIPRMVRRRFLGDDDTDPGADRPRGKISGRRGSGSRR